MPDYKLRLSALIVKSDKFLVNREEAQKNVHLPGGGWEMGEDLEEGLKRELYEELGLTDIKINSIAFVANYSNSKNKPVVEICYLVTTTQIPFASGEIFEIKYISLSEAGRHGLNPIVSKKVSAYLESQKSIAT